MIYSAEFCLYNFKILRCVKGNMISTSLFGHTGPKKNDENLRLSELDSSTFFLVTIFFSGSTGVYSSLIGLVAAR